MGLGTSVGGWKIIKTVGGNIMKIRPINGVAADLSGAMIIFGATFIGLPVSTTHVISSSIMGVGASHRFKRRTVGNCTTNDRNMGHHITHFRYCSWTYLLYIELYFLINPNNI